MIRYLIKNNIKLMLRSKWIIAVILLGPVLVTAVLASAFKDLLKSYESAEEFKAGYRTETGSVMENGMAELKEAAKEAGIILQEYTEGNPEELMEHNGLAAFAEIGQESYTVYESTDYKQEGALFEYFLGRVMREGASQALRTMMPVPEKEEKQLPVKELDYMPAVDSTDYYGIIYIVYFLWFGIVCAATVLSSEKKNGIEQKFQVTGIPGWKLYLGKWIPIVAAMALEIGIAATASILLFDIHWGKPLLSAALCLLCIMAGAAFGLMIYYLCRNLAVTVGMLFTSVWFMGFFGGSFETYMFAPWSEAVKSISPIYHINRALVEYSCMGQSSYTASSICYMLAMIVGCSVIAVFADKMRKRGRA